MRTCRVLGFVTLTLLGLGGTSLAGPLYSWVQVVERGMPDFNNEVVAQEALATDPLHLSFPSGVCVTFAFVRYEDQAYGVYYDRKTLDVVGIARVAWDPGRPQGLRYDEFFVDTGLLNGVEFTGQFMYMAENDRVFAALCRIADMSKEARPHRLCPRNA